MAMGENRAWRDVKNGQTKSILLTFSSFQKHYLFVDSKRERAVAVGGREMA